LTESRKTFMKWSMCGLVLTQQKQQRTNTSASTSITSVNKWSTLGGVMEAPVNQP
jgi:hypothetical protein